MSASADISPNGRNLPLTAAASRRGSAHRTGPCQLISTQRRNVRDERDRLRFPPRCHQPARHPARSGRAAPRVVRLHRPPRRARIRERLVLRRRAQPAAHRPGRARRPAHAALEDKAFHIRPETVAACRRRPADGSTWRSSNAATRRSRPIARAGAAPLLLLGAAQDRAHVDRRAHVASRRDQEFEPEAVDLIVKVSGQIAIAIENAMAYQEILELKERLALENVYLEGELRESHGFRGIVGDSPSLRRCCSRSSVSPPPIRRCCSSARPAPARS